MTEQHTSHLRLNENDCNSPARDSSTTDSQHLLDAEAQAYELEEAGRAFAPPPLNVGQHRHGIGIPRQRQCGAYNRTAISTVHRSDVHATNLFSHREAEEDHREIRLLPMEREISQKLRHVSRNIGLNGGTFYGPNMDENFIRPARPQGEIFSQPSIPAISAGNKPLRHIKVIIGRDSETGEDSQDRYGPQVNAGHNSRNNASEDGDWVTEATSDVGFETCTSTPPGRPMVVEFKRAGSSLADYSDDGTVDRFGSQERIIDHPAEDNLYKPDDIQRLNESKFAILLPRQRNAFQENGNRRWESTRQQEPASFRPQTLHKSTNAYREVDSRRPWAPKRLVFNFDENAPPRYEFRDSVSEYEPATASTKANCGTHQYDTHGSLPSPELQIGEDNHPSLTDALFDRSVDLDADQSPFTGFPRQNKANQASHHNQDTKLSLYDRQRQLEELEVQEFAAASSYYDPPSADSVKSKFNFELLPLQLAQRKNKLQRDSGQTNETESAVARLTRKQTVSSANPATHLLEPPAKAFFTSRELSISFSPSNWQGDNISLEGMLALGKLYSGLLTSDANLNRYTSSICHGTLQ